MCSAELCSDIGQTGDHRVAVKLTSSACESLFEMPAKQYIIKAIRSPHLAADLIAATIGKRVLVGICRSEFKGKMVLQVQGLRVLPQGTPQAGTLVTPAKRATKRRFADSDED